MQKDTELVHENRMRWRLIQHISGPQWLAHKIVDEVARIPGVSPPVHVINVDKMLNVEVSNETE